MLFDSIVYGPIHSRRLGLSLGMNIMPRDQKVCTFDCVYCECGWNGDMSHPHLPTRQEVATQLEEVLSQMKEQPDVITFSGNGEPTLHPEFAEIIDDTIALRNRYCPKARVSVLSNSTQLGRESVREALLRCDQRILKLDSAIEATMHQIDQPVNPHLSVEQVAQWLEMFQGQFTLQTCFVRGEKNGQPIDNTTPTELEAWYRMVDRLHPNQIMIYVIDRVTPLDTLEKISKEQMEAIATPLREQGYCVIVSA